MLTELPSRVCSRLFLFAFAATILFGLTGCSQSSLAPELQYSPAEVEKLSEKIEEFDW